MNKQGGRAARAWAKERSAWADRPHLWKLYLLLTFNMGVQVALAVGRGSHWFAGVAAVGLVLGAALTTIAFRARARG